MANLNKTMIIGNIGRDCELRYSSAGTAMGTFSVAVSTPKRKLEGGWEEETEWFNVVMFGDTAERMSQRVSKGKQVYVEGRMKTRTWDNNEGVKQYRTELLANTVQLLDREPRALDSGDTPQDLPFE